MNERKSDPDYVVELRNVSRRFGVHDVLRDITFGVRRGETLVVIGESGCGKSVTMKMIMSLLEPTAGDVLWHGRSIKDRSTRELHRDRLRIGYLFQGAALFDSLSVYENVALRLRKTTNLRNAEIGRMVTYNQTDC